MENKEDYIVVRTDGSSEYICEENMTMYQATESLKKHKNMSVSAHKFDMYKRNVTYTLVK